MNIEPRPEFQKAKVLLVEDHELVRVGMACLIAQQPDLEVCGEAENPAEAMDAITRCRPNLAIVELALKKGDGLELIKNIEAQCPELPVLVLSMHAEALYAELALHAGADGYVMKCAPAAQIVAAIRRVLCGGIYLSEAMGNRMLQQQLRGQTAACLSPFQRLSDRERHVLHLLGQWRTTREIAGQLHLSIKTIEHYRGKIKEKLNLSSAPELVQFALCWAQSATPRHAG